MKLGMQRLLFLIVAPGMLYLPAFRDREISIAKNEATVIFPRYIKFQLDASSSEDIQSVSLVYGVDRLSCQESTSRLELDFEPDKQVSLAWRLEFDQSGMIPPGTEVWWQWVLIDKQGVLTQTEKKSLIVQDGRFEWQRLDRKGISVQWHQGSLAFGQAILQHAERTLHNLSSQMDIQPTRKIHIIVYASTEEMHVALVRSEDWVGAVAMPDYGIILLGLPPTDLSYAKNYISHELTHLIVAELTFNCMGVELPTWLNEGLAENVQGEPSQEDLDAVILAIESQTLPSLNDIASGFSADGDQARLEYIQSNLVVGYLQKTYGPEKISALLAAFQSGLLTDEALQTVYRMDTAGLDAAWRKSLGFIQADTKPVKIPSRTPVPTLALWTIDLPPTGTPTSTPKPRLTSTVSPTASRASPTSTLAKLTPTSVDDSHNKPLKPACLVILIVPTILFLSLIRRKESAS